jgi:CTP:molybdopterin cytidylyltransferase MocA
MIQGIVLAAGRSRRMGTAKALLEIDGESFLALAVDALRAGGCASVIVVVGVDEAADRIARAAEALGAHIVRNGQEGAEQIDSLRLALAALDPAAEAAVVLPVDFPRVRAATVAKLCEAFRVRRAPVVVPVAGGELGHPTLFARAVFAELRAGPLAEGARTVVAAHVHDRLEVPVDDAAILRDVDTPADYARLLEGAP